MPSTRRFGRRACAAGLIASASLAACAKAGVQPALRHGGVTLTVALDVYALAHYGTAKARSALYAKVLGGFEKAHPGIRVRQVPFLPTPENQTAIIAGTAPDVFPDCCVYGSYVWANLLLPLTDLLRRDNVNLAVFSPGIVRWLTFPSGVFGMSRQTDVNAFAVDFTTLNTLGVAQPAPKWTAADFLRIATAASRPARNGKPARYGATFIYGGINVLREFTHGFGARVLNAARTRQDLASPEAIAAGRWWFERLLWPGVATSGFASTPGQTAIQNLDMNSVLRLYTAWRTNPHWRFYQAPAYAHGPSTAMAGNFWGIPATTRHPDHAWLLLRWLTLATAWQRFTMRTFLFPPALNHLLAEWQHIVESTVPGLKNRGLESFVTAATSGWADVAELNLAYASSQAAVIDGNWWGQIQTRKVGVHVGFTQADQAVNALEQTARTQRTLARAVTAHYPSRGPRIATVTPGL